MNIIDIDSIKALESGPICLRNYLAFLCQKDIEVRVLFNSNNKKLKEDLKNLRDDLEIDRWVSPLEFARRIKDYGFMSEMIITDAKDISKYKDSFPLFACLKNDSNENILLYVHDINDEGIVIKDMNYNDALIDINDFTRAFRNRMIVIKEYKGFREKYDDNRALKAFADSKDKYNIDFDGNAVLDGLGVALDLIRILLEK